MNSKTTADDTNFSYKEISLAELNRHEEAILCYDRVIEINPKLYYNTL